MADIDRYLQDIKDAKYGRDVRDSIHDGIEAINNEVEAAHDEMDAFVQGNMDTTLTSTVLPAQGKAVGDAIAAAKTAVEGELSAAESSIAADITRAESAAKEYADTQVDGLHDQTLAAFDQYEQGNRGIFKDITLGWYYALDGQTAPYEGWGITKQIPVKPGDVVHFKSPVSSEYNMFYDSTYSKVAGSGFTTSGTGSVVAPEGAAYVGFSNTEAGIKQLDVWLDGEAKIEQDVAELKSALSEETRNIIPLINTSGTVNNVTVVTDAGTGMVRGSGSATAAGYLNITDVFTLPAGEYTLSSNANNHLYLQVRTTDNVYVAQTGYNAPATFTLAESTDVRVRAVWTANYNETAVIYPQLESGNSSTTFIRHIIALDMLAREQVGNIWKASILESGSDLNNLNVPGLYRGLVSYNYVNAPSSASGTYCLIAVIGTAPSGSYKLMYYIVYGTDRYQIFIRQYANNSWGEWELKYDMQAVKKTVWEATFLPTNTDINTITTPGLYRGNAGAYEYDNIPESLNQPFYLEVIGDGTGGSYRIQTIVNYNVNKYQIYVRFFANGAWGSWSLKYDLQDIIDMNKKIDDRTKNTILDSFTGVSMSSQGENSGDNLRIMSYNICNFNFDTTTFISAEKLFNLKKMFYKANADIVCCQEDRQYIDYDNTKDSDNYVYYPILPFRFGGGGTTIHGKKNWMNRNYDLMKYSTDPVRTLRNVVYEIGNKKLLIISTHPGLTPENRAIEYNELFKWINGEITLKRQSDNVDITVPEHTHCIICGDMNCLTDEDKTNLLREAHAYGFIAGNGDPIGWFVTNMRHNASIDSIIVSDNIIINNIESYNSLYNDLYSDHVPVVADVTLL